MADDQRMMVVNSSGLNEYLRQNMGAFSDVSLRAEGKNFKVNNFNFIIEILQRTVAGFSVITGSHVKHLELNKNIVLCIQ